MIDARRELWLPQEPARRFVAASGNYLGYASAAVAADPLTMACWFWSTSATLSQTLIGLTDSGDNSNYYRILLRGDIAGDYVRADARTSGGFVYSAITTAGYKTDQWQHACGIFASATDRRIYLNGGSVGQNTESVIPTTLNRTAVGVLWRSALVEPHSGLIFWPAIWRAELFVSELQRLAAGTPPWLIRPESIVACPRMDSLYDPYLRAYWANNGTEIAQPLRIADQRRTVLWLPGDAGEATEITPADLTQAQTLSEPTITQTHVITPADLTQSQTLDAPAITQVHVIQPADLTQGQELTSPLLVQTHVIAPADLTQSQTLGSPELVEGASVQPADLAQTQTLSEPTLSQTHVIQPADLTQGQTLGEPTLLQTHVISPSDLTQTQTLGSPEIVAGLFVQPANLTQIQELSWPLLTQVHIIAPVDLLQGQMLTEPTISELSSVIIPGIDIFSRPRIAETVCVLSRKECSLLMLSIKSTSCVLRQ